MVLSSYSAMCLQQDGHIGFFFEEAPCYQDDYTKGYCMVYLRLSVEEITGGKYSIIKYSLDEFPQFYNVLKGDLSLVGTRPPTLDEWEKYHYHHRARLSAKPGITGLWQVSGRSSITDFEEVVKLDKEYITDWNIGVDVKIIFKTIRKGSLLY